MLRRIEGHCASAPIRTICRSPTRPTKASRTSSRSSSPQKLGKHCRYTWWAQRRGFVRNTLKAGRLRRGHGRARRATISVETTRPYYRSTYVFVSRHDRTARHLVDRSIRACASSGSACISSADDGNNTPPAHALGEQGIVDNVVGYTIYGDYREPNPPARLIEAVENGEIDVAAAWGPLAGYFAKTVLRAAERHADQGCERFAPLRLQFDIAMGVRKGDHALRDQLNAFIDEHRSEIKALLQSYGVPLVDLPITATGGHQ